MPNGIGGTTLGLFGITATDLSFDKGTGTSLEYSETYRDTRGGESGFNDQLFLANTNTVFALGTVDQQPITDKLAFNGNASRASNRHTVDAEPNTGLAEGESASFLSSVMNESRTTEATVNEYRSTIGDSAIGVADVNVSSDLPAPGGEGTIADLNVFNAKKLSLVSLQPLPGLAGQQNGIVAPPPSSMLHPDWARARISKIKIRFSMAHFIAVAVREPTEM